MFVFFFVFFPPVVMNLSVLVDCAFDSIAYFDL